MTWFVRHAPAPAPPLGHASVPVAAVPLGDEAWSRFGAMPDSRSTTVDINTSGFGVCRGYVHLAISFWRALNIPARYILGYLPNLDGPPDAAPMDFAAWHGRDASDVAMLTTFGAPLLELMSVDAAEEM
jgi:hypothetical protein